MDTFYTTLSHHGAELEGLVAEGCTCLPMKAVKQFMLHCDAVKYFMTFVVSGCFEIWDMKDLTFQLAKP